MNKLFQRYWYYIAKGFTKRKVEKNTGITLDDFSDRMVSQIKTSKYFGVANLVIIGDSNGEELADFESMKRLPKLSINLAIAGTRGDHWTEFFTKSEVGKKIYEEIKDKNILLNIMGNNILQKKMDTVESIIEDLHKLFPNAYWINIPAIWGSLVAGLENRDSEKLKEDLKVVNALIKNTAKSRLIDIASLSGMDEITPYWFTHKDAVHFTDEFDYKVRIPLIKAVIYGSRK